MTKREQIVEMYLSGKSIGTIEKELNYIKEHRFIMVNL
jgi:hypothetical protein